MNDANLINLDQIKQFLHGSQRMEFKPVSLNDRYQWIANTLLRFGYHRLRKKDRGIVREYILKITGYSRQQLTRLIAQHKETRRIGRRLKPRSIFPKVYTTEDVRLLVETDKYHNTLSGPATKKLFERAHSVYDDKAYIRLAKISVSHIYNLRQSKTYLNQRRHFTKTQHTKVAIGERRKPNPNNQPGYLRIDTVHQGDQDKTKGVYHINAVDEVTQMEVVCSVEKISERYLIPVLEQLISDFPFIIKGFHTDNGSEYINKTVAALLQKLLIEFTKSRPRHSNDNALAESKNASIVRKCLGYVHIPQKWAPKINIFYKNYLNPYINYHRPCYFPVIETDKKGKQIKKYPFEAMMTPYEKFKSLPGAKNYLKPSVTIDSLDAIAKKMTDIQAAKRMCYARSQLFKEIFS